MKTINRWMLIVVVVVFSMIGGFLANRLDAARVQAAPLGAGFGPNLKLTLLSLPNASTNPDLFDTTAVKIADIGTFTVENESSLVEVTHQGRLLVESFSGTNSVYYELRVDNLTGSGTSGLAQYRYQDAGQYIPITFSGYWYNLTPGTHTVSMWVRTSSGTANNAFLDPGGWASNLAIVKEFLPFGTTYLPSIVR